MKAYSTQKPAVTHARNGITYLNCNAVEETAVDEMTQQPRTQWVYDSVAVVNGNFIAAGIRARYSWDDEIALINNHAIDPAHAGYATYQTYRAEIKGLIAGL